MDDVTILVLTANRPEQLYRLLRYYAASPEIGACKIMVADGSTPENTTRFDAMMRSASFDITYDLQRFSSTIGFPQRLQQAFATVSTRYVMLAADDDFYFPDWVSNVLGEFDRRSDVTAMIGNYCVFGLNRFTAFSDTVSIVDGGPERFAIPWLEGDTAEARIGELAANPHGIQTIAWYALHRTKVLARILDHSSHYDLPLLLFERFFTVAQAASGKTHFTPAIFLARQADANPADHLWRNEPMSLAKQQRDVAELEACTRTFLTDVLGYGDERSAELVATAYANQIRMMRQADNRRVLRYLVNRLGIRRWLTAFRHAKPPQLRDPRLPQRCDEQELRLRGEQVRLACRPDPQLASKPY
ncbi:TIGR00180 family glycosyltransferase [Sphingomonas sp. CFBP 13603]|uniref:TIGR00180 family glycosyltransferase n=1 Tax=Sphingomonas sp. CFBP 13603 TaxID=2774040 RepID=UPI001868A388|nr:TIGR00180 family glycosyltransferase [Sphingomonas sp. CFBP 13603]MBE2992951.1 TIGR00180 family glycosyltransferase [Sphingomonas sp. CFBP 13603]